jgi:hypothetical protein
MTKDEALKMAIDAMSSAYSNHGLMLQSNPAQDAWLYHGCDAKLFKALQACKEALEQPLTRDWKETIDERIAKDNAFKQALEQPSVAELNDEYLRDTHVQGLSQPAQEPVAWINVKDKLPPQEINFLSFSETFGYQVSMYSSNPLNSTGLPTLERLKITKWMPIPLYTHPTPAWQGNKEFVGLSDDEIWNIANFLGKNKEWDYPVMFAKTIEQALKEKNHA